MAGETKTKKQWKENTKLSFKKLTDEVEDRIIQCLSNIQQERKDGNRIFCDYIFTEMKKIEGKQKHLLRKNSWISYTWNFIIINKYSWFVQTFLN